MDGKHISIQSPPDSGSLYFNYKKFYSIVLLAACNHRYEFTIVEIGAYGSESDGGILSRSEFGRALDERNLNLPNESPNLPNTNIKVPYFFVGDEAFRMTKNMMRPYPGRHLENEKRIFNYRLSRARRCIEKAFGILVSRWRVFAKSIAFRPADVDNIVLAGVCLHNFLMSRTQQSVRQMYCPPEYTDREDENGQIINGAWRNEIPVDNIPVEVINNIGSRAVIQEAHNIRDTLAKYLNSPEGKVSWQEDYINRGRHQDT